MPTRHRGSPEEIRALDAYIKLVRAFNSLANRLAPTLAGSGLTEGQFGVLEALLHLGSLHQCDLARKHLQSGGNITMIVDNLEKASLVRRERSATDRRYVRVHLTPGGRKLITKLFPRHARTITEELAVLNASEQAELARLCRKLGLGMNADPMESSANSTANQDIRSREGLPLASGPPIASTLGVSETRSASSEHTKSSRRAN